ncbi:MAG: helix-turn-helix domain-containing protein [Burkholderiales bacterium]|nr:helix-turn-helix domain-containing protein [Burkholderiales bacterium]
MDTVYSTQRSAGVDQFVGFSNAIRARFLPIELRRLGGGEFHSEIRQQVAARVTFTRIACDPVAVTCSSALAVTLPKSDYLLRLQVDGHSALSQFGHEVVLEPGEFTILDPAAPYTISNRNGAVQCFLVGMAREFIDERLHDGTQFCALRYRADYGSGRVAFSLMSALAEEASALGGAEVEQAMRSAIMLLGPELLRRAGGTQPPGKRSRGMLRHRVEAYIEANLVDPLLTPRRIAEAHGISVRSLFKLFEDSGPTLAETIRERRLRRCFDDLLDRARCGETITSIAFANGFSDAAHFSRSFRNRFGCAPKSVRDQPSAQPALVLRERMTSAAAEASRNARQVKRGSHRSS